MCIQVGRMASIRDHGVEILCSRLQIGALEFVRHKHLSTRPSRGKDPCLCQHYVYNLTCHEGISMVFWLANTYIPDNAWHSRPFPFCFDAHLLSLFDLRVKLSLV